MLTIGIYFDHLNAIKASFSLVARVANQRSTRGHCRPNTRYECDIVAWVNRSNLVERRQ